MFAVSICTWHFLLLASSLIRLEINRQTDKLTPFVIHYQWLLSLFLGCFARSANSIHSAIYLHYTVWKGVNVDPARLPPPQTDEQIITVTRFQRKRIALRFRPHTSFLIEKLYSGDVVLCTDRKQSALLPKAHRFF